ncbi:MAG TPA: YceI family protein [Thermoanaerobaculia bacterium]|nr:YceI family protein [Thermoanaerobaculia bacterium]
MLRPVAPLALLLLSSLPAAAQPLVLTVLPESSEIHFTLGATLHTVHGTARIASGEVQLDPAAGTASGRVVVDARSLATGNASRDKNLHQDVLESGRFPEIVLEVQGFDGPIAPSGTSRVALKGVLSIHGASHPVSYPVELSLEEGKVEAHSRFKLPFVAWGMKDPSAFVLRVDKEAEVEVKLVATLKPDPSLSKNSP